MAQETGLSLGSISETRVEIVATSPASRDAFWMNTVGGDPYLVPTNGGNVVVRALSAPQSMSAAPNLDDATVGSA